MHEQSSLLQLDAKVSCVSNTGVGELCSLMEACLISGFGWSRHKFRMAQGSDVLRYLILFPLLLMSYFPMIMELFDFRGGSMRMRWLCGSKIAPKMRKSSSVMYFSTKLFGTAFGLNSLRCFMGKNSSPIRMTSNYHCT